MIIPRLVENQRHLDLLIREIAYSPKVGELADRLALATKDIRAHYKTAQRLFKALISKDNKHYLRPIVNAFFCRYHGTKLDDETCAKIDKLMADLYSFEQNITQNPPNIFYRLAARFL